MIEPAFAVCADPTPADIALRELPAELRMFIYEREEQAQALHDDPEAFAVQDISSSDESSMLGLTDEGTRGNLPTPSKSNVCLVQLATGAAVHAAAPRSTCKKRSVQHQCPTSHTLVRVARASTRLPNTLFR